MVRKEELTYKSRDRQTMLHAIRWIPEGEPKAILQIIPDMGIEETARANAAKVLVPMLTQLGYEEQNITIAFRNDLDFRHKYQGLIRFED